MWSVKHLSSFCIQLELFSVEVLGGYCCSVNSCGVIPPDALPRTSQGWLWTLNASASEKNTNTANPNKSFTKRDSPQCNGGLRVQNFEDNTKYRDGMKLSLEFYFGTLQQYDASQSWMYKTAPKWETVRRSFFTKNGIFVLSTSYSGLHLWTKFKKQAHKYTLLIKSTSFRSRINWFIE